MPVDMALFVSSFNSQIDIEIPNLTQEKMNRNGTGYALLLFFAIVIQYSGIGAQEIPAESRYEFLLLKVELLTGQEQLNGYDTELLQQAKKFSEAGDYELAVVYLEELLSFAGKNDNSSSR